MSMPLMTSQILTSDDFSKTQKSRYLENEMRFSNKKINSLQIKSYFIPKNNFVVEVVFNYIRKKSLSWINPFVSNAPFLYGKGFWCFQGVEKGCIGNEWVKKTWRFSDVFRRQRKGALGTNGLSKSAEGNVRFLMFSGGIEMYHGGRNGLKIMTGDANRTA